MMMAEWGGLSCPGLLQVAAVCSTLLQQLILRGASVGGGECLVWRLGG